MTDAEIDVIEARAAAATPGEWVSRDVCDEGDSNCGDWIVELPVGRNSVTRLWFGDISENSGEDIANAEFIAASRTDIPALVAEVRRLRAERVVHSHLIVQMWDYGHKVFAASGWDDEEYDGAEEIAEHLRREIGE